MDLAVVGRLNVGGDVGAAAVGDDTVGVGLVSDEVGLARDVQQALGLGLTGLLHHLVEVRLVVLEQRVGFVKFYDTALT